MSNSIASPSDLGVCVRRDRRRRGWTQQQLADSAGVSRTFVSQLEAGKPTIELALALRTLGALGVVLVAEQRTSSPHSTNEESIDLDELLGQLGAIDG